MTLKLLNALRLVAFKKINLIPISGNIEYEPEAEDTELEELKS